MTADERSDIDPAILQRAAEWMARLWSDEASTEDRTACEGWRHSNSENERAWNRLQRMDRTLIGVARTPAGTALQQRVASSRRKALQLLGLAALASSAAYAVRETSTWELAVSDYATHTGEIREFKLPDGTRVVLGTSSAIDVRFDAVERRVVLRAGEVLITTAPDPAAVHRDFVVQTPQGTVQALGTRFTVRQDGVLSRVAVFEGAVEVRPARPGSQPMRLDAGQRASFADDRVHPPAPVEDSAAAWAQGQLVAERMRMADFVSELSRYRSGVLRCSPDVAELMVSGVFPLRDTDRALSNLTLGLPIDVVYRTRYWVTVQAR